MFKVKNGQLQSFKRDMYIHSNLDYRNEKNATTSIFATLLRLPIVNNNRQKLQQPGKLQQFICDQVVAIIEVGVYLPMNKFDVKIWFYGKNVTTYGFLP